MSYAIGHVPTGIYCRLRMGSGCCADVPADADRFVVPAAAEAAGLRACHNCRPYQWPQTAGRGAPELVCRTVQLILGGALDVGTEAVLAARLGVSGRHLRRLFMNHLGVTPDALARSSRAHFARRLLDDTDLSVTEIAFIAGFGSARQFNRECRQIFRATPTELRARRSCPARTAADGGLTLRLWFTGQLDWDALARFLDARGVPGVEHVDMRAYRRTIVVDGEPGMVELSPGGTDHLLLRVHLPRWDGLMHLAFRARRIASLDDDLAEPARSLANHSVIGPLLAARPGVRVPGAWDSYEAGVAAIIAQQTPVDAARDVLGRLIGRFGQHVLGPTRFHLTHTFPPPDVLARAGHELADVVPGNQLSATLSSFAAAVQSGQLRLDGSAEPGQMIASLKAITGLAPSTAQYIALRTGDPDAYPDADRDLQLALDYLARGQAITSDNWRPWRAYATANLWAAIDRASAPPLRDRVGSIPIAAGGCAEFR